MISAPQVALVEIDDLGYRNPFGPIRVEEVGGADLEAANVRCSRDGVEVDEYLRTSNPNIYAAGDVASPENSLTSRNS